MSGGLDSTTLLVLLTVQQYEVRTLFFDYGQPNAQLEGEIAAENAAKYGSLGHHSTKIPAEFSKQRAGYYPARNLVMLSAAAAYAESELLPLLFVGLVTVAHSPWRRDDYPDCSQQFLDAFNRTLELGSGLDMVVQAPLLDVQKPGVLQLARKLGVDPADTFSCLTSTDRERPCGSCDACHERIAAERA